MQFDTAQNLFEEVNESDTPWLGNIIGAADFEYGTDEEKETWRKAGLTPRAPYFLVATRYPALGGKEPQHTDRPVGRVLYSQRDWERLCTRMDKVHAQRVKDAENADKRRKAGKRGAAPSSVNGRGPRKGNEAGSKTDFPGTTTPYIPDTGPGATPGADTPFPFAAGFAGAATGDERDEIEF